MTTMYGADADALDAAGNLFTARAEQLRRIRKTLGAQVHQTPWPGPNGDRFRADWNRRHAGALDSVASELDVAASRLHSNARAQREASLLIPLTVLSSLGLLGPGQGADEEALSALTRLLMRTEGQGDLFQKFPELFALLGDTKDLKANAVLKDRVLDGGGLMMGGLAIASFLLGQQFPDGSTGRLAADTTSHVLDIGQSAFTLIKVAGAHSEALSGLGKVAPWLGIVTGAIGMGSDVATLLQPESNKAQTGIKLGADTLTAVGSGLLMIPGPTMVVGAGMLAGAAVIDTGLWAYNHRQEIGAFMSDAGKVAGDVAHAELQVATSVVKASEHAMANVAQATVGVVHGLKGLFS